MSKTLEAPFEGSPSGKDAVDPFRKAAGEPQSMTKPKVALSVERGRNRPLPNLGDRRHAAIPAATWLAAGNDALA